MSGRNWLRLADDIRWLCIIFVLLYPLPVLSGHAPQAISGVPVVDAEALIDLVTRRDDAVIIDARLQSDYVRGHIDGAINIPNTETDCHMLSRIVSPSTRPVVFYCNGASCMRSTESIRIARSCGYDKVYWFRGGFEEWLAKGYPYLKK